ncbi:hypothetical protein GQ42DRAFT_160494 [Ramicandelaber brevisporus]|nr:hypothetical protein GQ42DRAFT_160494 [Ramicandelaber brevisporus]
MSATIVEPIPLAVPIAVALTRTALPSYYDVVNEDILGLGVATSAVGVGSETDNSSPSVSPPSTNTNSFVSNTGGSTTPAEEPLPSYYVSETRHRMNSRNRERLRAILSAMARAASAAAAAGATVGATGAETSASANEDEDNDADNGEFDIDGALDDMNAAATTIPLSMTYQIRPISSPTLTRRQPGLPHVMEPHALNVFNSNGILMFQYRAAADSTPSSSVSSSIDIERPVEDTADDGDHQHQHQPHNSHHSHGLGRLSVSNDGDVTAGSRILVTAGSMSNNDIAEPLWAMIPLPRSPIHSLLHGTLANIGGSAPDFLIAPLHDSFNMNPSHHSVDSFNTHYVNSTHHSSCCCDRPRSSIILRAAGSATHPALKTGTLYRHQLGAVPSDWQDVHRRGRLAHQHMTNPEDVESHSLMFSRGYDRSTRIKFGQSHTFHEAYSSYNALLYARDKITDQFIALVRVRFDDISANSNASNSAENMYTATVKFMPTKHMPTPIEIEFILLVFAGMVEQLVTTKPVAWIRRHAVKPIARATPASSSR